MRIRKLLNDDEAVSPVIGVILMVAITVILAAVIATFVLGLGEQVSQTAPSASFTFDLTEDTSGEVDSWGMTDGNADSPDNLLTMTHAGGATIDAARLSVVGPSPADYSGWTEAATDASGSDLTMTRYSSGDDVTAGDSLDIWADDGDTVRIIWESEDAQDSATLAEYEVPE